MGYTRRNKIPEDVKISEQVRKHATTIPEDEQTIDFGNIVSTGSTLLDLAISGGAIRGGGLPGGILVEVFGPSGCGKSVLLCEIAGAIKRKGGDVIFCDPEGRLNTQFASIFDFSIKNIQYERPDTVKEFLTPIGKWKPENIEKINGIMGDSLAALCSDMEMDGEDKMGMRRAKEFSEELRKICRIIANKKYLMVCSNQIRQNLDAGPYGAKYKSTGGEAINFYASLRLKCGTPEKIKTEKTIAGKKQNRVVGVDTEIQVYKSSIWKPFHSAPLSILFDYGIDNIRQNLIFIKQNSESKVYTIGSEKLSNSLEESITIIETEKRERELSNEVIDLWEEIEKVFEQTRKPKNRIMEE
jgi:RecA/RadA recombinase